VSALAACSSGDTSDEGGFPGSGGGSGGLVQVDECDVVADCDADLTESAFDPTCVEVTCEDHQCRFTGGTLNGGTCDDGSACTINDVCDAGYDFIICRVNSDGYSSASDADAYPDVQWFEKRHLLSICPCFDVLFFSLCVRIAGID